MFKTHRSNTMKYFTITLLIILFVTLTPLNTSPASASAAYDHLEVCTMNVPSRLISTINFTDFGEELDARLEAELGAVRCTAAELEQGFELVTELISPHAALLEVALGLEQDLRLGEELSAARGVAISLSARLSLAELTARQIISQEARDASLVSELAFESSRGLDQDLRLAEELSTASKLVTNLRGRQPSSYRIASQITSQEVRDAGVVDALTFEVVRGIDQDVRLARELSSAISVSRTVSVNLSAR